MSSMRRWRDVDSGSSDLERAVLRAAAEPEIPNGAREQGWQRLSASLASAGAVVAVTKPAAAAAPTAIQASVSSVASLAFVKGVVAGVVGCVLVQSGIGSWLSSAPERGTPTAPSAAPAVTSAPAMPAAAPPPLASAAQPQIEPERAASLRRPGASSARTNDADAAANEATSGPSVADFVADSTDLGDRTSALAKEAALLRRARSELYGGDASAALATLELSRRDVQSPQLLQEREALMIEALSRTGRRAEAIARARDYVRRFPDSPHAGKLRTLVSVPELPASP